MARPNLSILKEAKKLYGSAHFFLGVGIHLLIPFETYTSYDFLCQESLPPLWTIQFLRLFLGCNQYWSGLVYVFHVMSRSSRLPGSTGIRSGEHAALA